MYMYALLGCDDIVTFSRDHTNIKVRIEIFQSKTQIGLSEKRPMPLARRPVGPHSTRGRPSRGLHSPTELGPLFRHVIVARAAPSDPLYPRRMNHGPQSTKRPPRQISFITSTLTPSPALPLSPPSLLVLHHRSPGAVTPNNGRQIAAAKSESG